MSHLKSLLHLIAGNQRNAHNQLALVQITAMRLNSLSTIFAHNLNILHAWMQIERAKIHLYANTYDHIHIGKWMSRKEKKCANQELAYSMANAVNV